MDTSSNRKKFHIIIFGLCFAGIVFITLLANWRSALVREVHFPFNNGVAYICTRGNYLTAASHDDKLYVWDWNDLSAKPRIFDMQSDQAVLLESGHIASVKRSNAQAVDVTNLDNGNVDAKIPIHAENKRVYLGANRGGSSIAAVLVNVDDIARGTGQEVVVVDCVAGLVDPVVILGEAALDRIMGMAVSDDGVFVALAGEMAGRGRVVLVSVKQKRVAWFKELPDLQKVRNAVFSTDGKLIYLRGTDSTVQIMDAQTGGILKRLLPMGENKSTAGDQSVQTLAASSDGSFLAASISGTVYVWDCKTEKVILKKGPGHKLVGGMTFSPDSRYLATCDSRQGGTIKIWRIPKR
jgi:WD40 repeat protein